MLNTYTVTSPYLPTPCSRVLLDKLTGLQLVKKFPYFMEPEGSLPHSQVHVTCPYTQPARSSPYLHFLKTNLNIILPSTPGSSNWSPSLTLPHENPIHTSFSIRATCPAHLILLDFITRTILGEKYKSLSS